MQETISINIQTKHFRESRGYTNPFHCPLALSVKEFLDSSGEYPSYRMGCHLGNVWIYLLDEDLVVNYDVTFDWNDNQRVYKGEYKGYTIEEMILLAKKDPNLEFPTITLELIRNKYL